MNRLAAAGPRRFVSRRTGSGSLVERPPARRGNRRVRIAHASRWKPNFRIRPFWQAWRRSQLGSLWWVHCCPLSGNQSVWRLQLPGLLICLYGYATAIYIAFTEDDLHGWLCLLFPFYAAYYIVSRWDEMRSRVAMVVAGLTLLAVGGRFLESDRARAEGRTPEAAEKA